MNVNDVADDTYSGQRLLCCLDRVLSSHGLATPTMRLGLQQLCGCLGRHKDGHARLCKDLQLHIDEVVL